MFDRGKLERMGVAQKLMSFGAKGVYQGLKNGVTFEIKINYVPFVTSVHYMLCLGMFSQK